MESATYRTLFTSCFNVVKLSFDRVIIFKHHQILQRSCQNLVTYDNARRANLQRAIITVLTPSRGRSSSYTGFPMPSETLTAPSPAAGLEDVRNKI